MAEGREYAEPSGWSRALLDIALPRHTDRLFLRLLTEDDARAMAEYHSRPDVVRYLGAGVRDESAIATRLRTVVLPRYDAAVAQPTLPLAVIERSSGRLIGDVTLRLTRAHTHPCHGNRWRHADAEISYVINPDFQGRGYGAEAATELVRLAADEIRCRKIVATIFTEHAASLRVAAAAGLRHERTARAAWLAADGRWLDDDTWSFFPADPRRSEDEPDREDES